MSLKGILSFDRDIAEEVYRRTGGKYSVDQIEDVLKSSIQFARMLLRYTDVCRVRIPKLGYFYTNIRHAKRDLNSMSKIPEEYRKKYPAILVEEKALAAKIAALTEYIERNKEKLPNSSLFTCDIAQKRKWQKQGRSYSEIEDIQEKTIKDLLT